MQQRLIFSLCKVCWSSISLFKSPSAFKCITLKGWCFLEVVLPVNFPFLPLACQCEREGPPVAVYGLHWGMKPGAVPSWRILIGWAPFSTWLFDNVILWDRMVLRFTSVHHSLFGTILPSPELKVYVGVISPLVIFVYSSCIVSTGQIRLKKMAEKKKRKRVWGKKSFLVSLEKTKVEKIW